MAEPAFRSVSRVMSGQALERDIIARPPVRQASVSRRQLGLAGAALLIGIGAAWYGYHWWTVGRFIESTDDAYVGGDVTVIAPKVAGFIAKVAVTDNQAVHAGDLLVKLDDRDYRAALAKAVAGGRRRSRRRWPISRPDAACRRR